MSLITDVADYLEAEGVGTVGEDIFNSVVPEYPDGCVTVVDTGGIEPSRDIPTAEPTFQVLVRNSSYDTAKTKIDSIVALLHQKANAELVSGETYFYYIFLVAEPGYLGRDDNDREEFSANFVCKTQR
jgi:hypothetical protein